MECKHEWERYGFNGRTYRCSKCLDITVLVLDKVLDKKWELFKIYNWRAWRM